MRIVFLKSFLSVLTLFGAISLFAKADIAAEVEYFYAKDGTIIGRAVNGGTHLMVKFRA